MEIYKETKEEEIKLYATSPYKTDFIHLKEKKRNILKDYIYINTKKVLV